MNLDASFPLEFQTEAEAKDYAKARSARYHATPLVVIRSSNSQGRNLPSTYWVDPDGTMLRSWELLVARYTGGREIQT